MERHCHDIVQTLDVIVWERQPTTLKFTFVSQQAEEILGYPVEQWLTQANFWTNLIHPDDRDSTVALYDRAITKGKRQEIEFRAIAADGRVVWLRDRLSTVKDIQGNLQRLSGFIVDIPHRQPVEILLQKSEQQFDSVENTLDCFSIYKSIRDESGRITDFKIEHINTGTCADNLCSSKEEQIGKRMCELLPAERETGLFDKYCQVVETGIPLIEESLIYENEFNQQRLVKAYDIRASKLDDGFVATLRDITHTKQIEEELCRCQREIKTIVENAPLLIARTDREFRHVYVNPAIAQLTGITQQEFAGKTHRELGFPEANCAMWEAYFQQIFTTAQELTVEFELSTPSYRTRTYCSRMVPEFALDGSVQSVLGIAYDITERKISEDKLRASEERFRAFFEVAPFGIVVANLDDRIVNVNQAICKMLGYTPEELTALTIAEITHPEDSVKHLRLAKQLFQGEIASYQLEKRYFKKNQEILWVNLTVTVVRAGSGQPLYRLEMIEDTSEKKAAAERIQLYADIVKNVPVGLSVWQLQDCNDLSSFKLITSNPAAGEANGTVMEEFTETTLAESFPALLETQLSQDYAEVIHTGIAKNFEELLYSNEQSAQQFFSIKVFPLPNHCVGLAFENITERKKLERSLKESEESFRFLADSIPQLIWTAQPDGELDYINRRVSNYSGLTAERVLGWGWQQIVHPDDVDRSLDCWKHSLKTGTTYEVEFRLHSSDGQYRWHLVRALPMRDAENRIIKWFGTCTDIDDQKRAEQAAQFLSEASTLLASSLECETTLASVAHLAVPSLADYCAVDIVESNELFRRVAAVHQNPIKEQLLRDIERRYPAGLNGQHPIVEVLRTGKSQLYPEMPDRLFVATAVDAEHLKMLRALGVKSYMSVPLIARERVLGAISFATAESDRQYSAGDLALAEDLAHRAAMAIDNALLYRETQEAERRKDESLALLNALLESAPVGFAFHDRELRFVRLNSCLARINGIPLADHIGRTLEEILPAEIAAIANTTHRHVLNTGEPVLNLEVSGQTLAAPDQRRHWLANYYPVRSGTGEILGVGAAVADITELKRVEEALRHSEERFRLLFENAPLGITIARNGINLYANRAYLKIFGYHSISEVQGAFLLNDIAPEWRDEIGERVRQRERGEAVPNRYETLGKRRDGSVFPLQVNVAQIQLPDGPATTAFLSDISAAKQIESERAQLFVQEQQSRQLAEQTADRIARLQSVTAALSEALTASEVADAIITSGLAALGANVGVVSLLNEAGTKFENIRIVGYPQEVVAAWPGFAADAPVPIADAVRRRQPIVLETQAQRNAHYPHLVDVRAQASAGDGALVAIPMIVNERVVGGLGFGFREDREFNQDERAFMQALAQQCAQALERARLFEAERVARASAEAALDALQQSEARFRTMADNSPAFIWITGTDGRCTYFNQPWLDFTGYNLEEAHLMGRLSGMHPDDAHLCFDRFIAASKLRQGFQIEYRHKRADGEYRWIFDTGVPLHAPDGSFIGFIGSGIDITERKQAEEALRQSESRFRRLVESNMSGVIFWDETGKITDANNAFLQMVGYTREELEAGLVNWKKMTPPEQLYLSNQAIAQMKQGGAASPVEKNYIRKDGSLIPILLAGVMFEGSQDCGVSFVLDLTELKRIEAERQQSEARYRRIVETSYEGIWTTDAQGWTDFVNPRMAEMLGYTVEEMIGRSVFDFMDEAVRIEAEGNIERQKQGLKTLHEFRWRRKDGADLWALTSTNAILGEAGEYMGAIAMITDITDRKQASEKLWETNQTLNSLIQACPLAITVFNVSDGCVTLWNPGAERIFGWSEQEALGYFLPSVPEHKREEFLGHLRVIGQGQELIGVELRRHKKDGSPIDVAVWASGLRDAKGETSCISIVADISDRKRLEEEREQLLYRERAARADAEAANRVKDEFLAVLSHELRTPINAILGWARLLRTRTFDRTTTERALETIERNARLQTQLIEDLLDVSRILRGKTSLNISPVNLISTIEAALDTMRPAAEAKAIEIERLIDATVGLVAGDPNRLQQVVWNLLSNAIKFTPPEGGGVTIRLEGEGSMAKLQVSDTGIGIRADFLPHVFESFRQADGSTTRTHGGLGLGLAIVRHLVELHGGTIEAQSPGEGQGATFTVRLPLLDGKSRLKVKKGNRKKKRDRFSILDAPFSILSGVRVLVVDDDADTRDYIVMALEKSGACVTAAASVRAALVAFKQLRPDVLVSDIGMPGEDGYSLIRRVRALDREGNIPSVALTAYATEEDRRRVLEVGFQTHLTKPVDAEELIEVVARLSGRIEEGNL